MKSCTCVLGQSSVSAWRRLHVFKFAVAYCFFSLINSTVMITDTHKQKRIEHRDTHVHTHTCVVGASIRRHFPHKGHSCSRAAAGTATAKHYGTQTGMRVQSMHDCLPVCVSLCVLSESCGWVSPTGPSMQLLSLMHKTYEHKRKPAHPPLYTTHSLIHTVKIITTLKKLLRISACYRWSC